MKPNVEMWLEGMGLKTISSFNFAKLLPGGGSNFTALYLNGDRKAVAKFFFAGPHPVLEKRFRNELENHYQSLTLSKILPKIYQEFSSPDGFVMGYLMEFVEGTSLDKVLITPLGESVELFATFYRVLWAYKNALASQVHGDLHPSNIILESDVTEWINKTTESPELRILDLGASISPFRFLFEETFDKDLWLDHNRRFSGSFYSLAPEFLTEKFCEAMQLPGKLDCWGLGLLLYRMTTGQLLPIASSLGAYATTINDGRLQCQLDEAIEKNVCHYHLKILQKAMLRVDPFLRIDLLTATIFVSQLYRNDEELLSKKGAQLEEYMKHGCDPEWKLLPHERSDSPY